MMYILIITGLLDSKNGRLYLCLSDSSSLLFSLFFIHSNPVSYFFVFFSPSPFPLFVLPSHVFLFIIVFSICSFFSFLFLFPTDTWSCGPFIPSQFESLAHFSSYILRKIVSSVLYYVHTYMYARTHVYTCTYAYASFLVYLPVCLTLFAQSMLFFSS